MGEGVATRVDGSLSYDACLQCESMCNVKVNVYLQKYSKFPESCIKLTFRFRRMAHENVLDTFACLPRWDVDALHPVGRRLSNFVEVNSRSLPLKNISKVSLKKVTEESFDHYRRHWTAIDRIQLTVQTEHGSTTFCKKPSYDQKYDVSTIMLDIRPALG